jgi:peptidoglycan/LPS O-acetylase OafA/YrhL
VSSATIPNVAARDVGVGASCDHVRGLDGLRGLAIFAVVAFHAAVVVTEHADWAYHRRPPFYLWPLFAGSLGVDVFFVLSGFLVYRSWRTIKLRHRGNPFRAFAEFGRRRVRRLVPPYWFCLLILIPWRAPQWFGAARGPRNVLMFVSLNQFLDPGLPRRINAVTWSLTTEMHFYVLLPVLALLLVRLRWGRFVIAMLATAVVWRATAGGTGGAAEWIFGRVDQFGVGMAAAMLIADESASRRSSVVRLLHARATPWVLGLVLGVVGLTHGAMRLAPKPDLFLLVLHPLAGIAIAGCVVRAMTRGSMSALGHRPLTWLGTISYSLYLWHWPLLTETVGRWGPTSYALTGALAASVAIATLSYMLFERPLLRPRAATGTNRDEKLSIGGLQTQTT